MKSAERLLERMRQSSSGWGQNDFKTLYLGFGFKARKGGKHITYIHKKYPELRHQVGRHDKLATGYATFAVKLIDRLKALEAEEHNDTR